MDERRDSRPAEHDSRTKQELVGVQADAANGGACTRDPGKAFVLAAEITHDPKVVSDVEVRGPLPTPKIFPERYRQAGRSIDRRYRRAGNREAAEHFRFRIDHFLGKARNREEEQADSQKDHSSHLFSFSSERFEPPDRAGNSFLHTRLVTRTAVPTVYLREGSG